MTGNCAKPQSRRLLKESSGICRKLFLHQKIKKKEFLTLEIFLTVMSKKSVQKIHPMNGEIVQAKEGQKGFRVDVTKLKLRFCGFAK